jgi:hypothetical protein
MVRIFLPFLKKGKKSHPSSREEVALGIGISLQFNCDEKVLCY